MYDVCLFELLREAKMLIIMGWELGKRRYTQIKSTSQADRHSYEYCKDKYTRAS